MKSIFFAVCIVVVLVQGNVVNGQFGGFFNPSSLLGSLHSQIESHLDNQDFNNFDTKLGYIIFDLRKFCQKSFDEIRDHYGLNTDYEMADSAINEVLSQHCRDNKPKDPNMFKGKLAQGIFQGFAF